MSNLQEKIVGILKGYFNNAVIIDDELNNEYKEIPKISDEDLAYIPDELDDLEDLAAATRELESPEDQPSKLFHQLIDEGIVTFPYRYKSKEDDHKQLELISSVLKNTKLLILDWNLENIKSGSPISLGTASMKILKSYTQFRTGFKCAVIYTQEDTKNVLERLSKEFEIADEENCFFQDNKSEGGNSLFGFVVSKQTNSSQILGLIGDVLVQDKSIPLHIMDSVRRLEQSISITMNRFNAPFEMVMFTQMLSSHIENDSIPSFLDNTLLSEVLAEHSKTETTNFMFQSKKEKIIQTLRDKEFKREELERFFECIEFSNKNKNAIVRKLTELGFTEKIINILSDENISSFELLNSEVKRVAAGQLNDVHITELVLILMLIDEYRNDCDNFTETLRHQTYQITQLLKYFNDATDNVYTGSIWRVKDEEGTYMLCITPYCDTYRPEKVNNIYKFIIGKEVEPTSSLLKNSDVNSACIGVPIADRRSLSFIRWDFFNVCSLQKSSVESKLKKVATLKKEYIQNIINRYIGYQSRAGVEEMFFKETYRDYFSKLFI